MNDPLLTPEQNAERRRNLKSRNLALGAVLIGLVVLFYVVTIFKGVPLLNQRPI